MKELKLSELTTRQKIGMCFSAYIHNWPKEDYEENLEFSLSLIREHALGAVWVEPILFNRDEVIKKIKDTADYPIVIMCDAESGFDEYKVGRHNSIACTGSTELAYIFGKTIAIKARKSGYNCLCNPILDRNTANAACGGAIRALGCKKEKITEFAKAIARGMHDGGVLTVGKHYPSVKGGTIDTHLAEPIIRIEKEELINENLYPYIKLNEEGLLDGIMVGHTRIENIDPDYPASLSKSLIDIIRGLGFDGFAITDALIMGGVAHFGEKCRGMCIEAGNDFALCWSKNKLCFESMVKCYEEGMIGDAALDRAVSHVLEAQHKTIAEPKFTEITEEDIKQFECINNESTFGYLDEGVSPTLSRDGNHQFVVMIKNSTKVDRSGNLDVDTLEKSWYRPDLIKEKLLADFKNSTVTLFNEFPSSSDNWDIARNRGKYDDIVFITFFESGAFVGMERFTPPLISIIQAMQVSGKVSAIVHFGNPYLLEDLEHSPRVLVGGCSTNNIMATLDILAGKRKLKGKPVYDIKLK